MAPVWRAPSNDSAPTLPLPSVQRTTPAANWIARSAVAAVAADAPITPARSRRRGDTQFVYYSIE